VLNCAVSYALEAGLLFISNTCFPCDSQGVTCITLHFFTNFFRDVHQRYQERAKKEFFCPSILQGRRKVPALKRALATLRSGNACEDSAGGLSGDCHKNQFRHRLPATTYHQKKNRAKRPGSGRSSAGISYPFSLHYPFPMRYRVPGTS
jgi:hypothetical protein